MSNPSASFKVYGIIVLIGIGVASFAAWKWRNIVDDRYDSVQTRPVKARIETPPPDQIDYDLKGRVAALRAFKGHDDTRVPVFWAKGNLTFIHKNDWGNRELAYTTSRIERKGLHSLLDWARSLKMSSAPDLLEIVVTKADGTAVSTFAAEAIAREQIEALLGDRPRRPYTLQAVAVRAEAATPRKETPRWPFGRIPLDRLLKGEMVVVRRSELVKRLQSFLTESKVVMRGDLCALVSARAKVDR